MSRNVQGRNKGNTPSPLRLLNRRRSNTVKFVKLVSEHLAGPLTHIINACITSSTFPRTWKTARLSPIPKTDHPQNEKDYRPVSILPALSKVFERLVLKQLISSIEELSLLAPSISYEL